MGRYYHGDINGKFWFGIQNSLDASHFGGVGEYVYMWSCCGTHDDLTETDVGRKNECPNECYKDDDTKLSEVVIDENYARFEFKEDDIPTVLDMIYSLSSLLNVSETMVDEIINMKCNEDEDNYGFYTRCTDIIYSEYEKDKDSDNAELWARLYFGIEIYMCLKQTGSCSFDAEL